MFRTKILSLCLSCALVLGAIGVVPVKAEVTNVRDTNYDLSKAVEYTEDIASLDFSIKKNSYAIFRIDSSATQELHAIIRNDDTDVDVGDTKYKKMNYMLKILDSEGRLLDASPVFNYTGNIYLSYPIEKDKTYYLAFDSNKYKGDVTLNVVLRKDAGSDAQTAINLNEENNTWTDLICHPLDRDVIKFKADSTKQYKMVLDYHGVAGSPLSFFGKIKYTINGKRGTLSPYKKQIIKLDCVEGKTYYLKLSSDIDTSIYTVKLK